MLVDLQDILQNVAITPEEFAEELRREMKSKTDCNASVGIGSSILLARVATKKAKPNGVFHLHEHDAVDFFKVKNLDKYFNFQFYMSFNLCFGLSED